MFPTYCGLIVDFCTIPIFGPSIPIEWRVAFFEQHPATSLFLHWIIGTTFMFQFALYISIIRETLRPGLLWFIRDPNDPNFNPMQEIYNRPFFNQMRKLLIGVLLYSTIIVGIVGGTVGIVKIFDFVIPLQLGLTKILPIRWEFRLSIFNAVMVSPICPLISICPTLYYPFSHTLFRQNY